MIKFYIVILCVNLTLFFNSVINKDLSSGIINILAAGICLWMLARGKNEQMGR